ncbi:MAG TPA: BREX-2 system adenine-specific DNA-methyltransferase PglX, partial [Thermoanaerobaculia bacterium]
MIDASRLLDDCQRLVRLLEDDLRERLREHPELDARVQSEFERAKERQRTGQSYPVWRDEYLTQVAVHWVLAAVFVRFLEDNELLPEAWISGPGPRLGQARDRHERFFVREPAASDRDYLLACFREVERLPAMAPLFDERHNPLFKLGPTADGARAIVDLFRRPRPEGGGLLHDFSDLDWSTRFLGDLYQDLSEAARKRYALLQTPEFVEEFLLDRTLEPAIAEVGYQKVTLIDPACGSGHFLLGAFHRLFARWRKNDATTNDVGLAAKALDQIAGVDLNPFAVAIARFRLLVAALKVAGIRRLADAPAFPLHLATGDSLLHGGPRPGHLTGQTRNLFGADEYAHYYATEDEDELRRQLGRQYTVVVGNPPYITPKDPALNELYRTRFESCRGKYSIAVPFTERFFDLASLDQSTAGWVGMITANSFMKREFGKKLIEQYIPRWDLTHV